MYTIKDIYNAIQVTGGKATDRDIEALKHISTVTLANDGTYICTPLEHESEEGGYEAYTMRIMTNRTVVIEND